MQVEPSKNNMLFMILLIITACSTLPPSPEKNTIKPENNLVTIQKAWWAARFTIKWPIKNKEPDWYIGAFIANEIVSPTLEQFKQKISLWRFHRRAARDKAGHQLSFLFYTTPETARHIYAHIKSNQMLTNLKQANLIIRDGYDNPKKLKKPNIEDTSDKSWSISVQKAWPYFIMGASQLWLELIKQTQNNQKSLTMAQKIAHYKQVTKLIRELWKKEGKHAFLHHLNAIFGYAPLTIRF
jgi:hypothetical protein